MRDVACLHTNGFHKYLEKHNVEEKYSEESSKALFELIQEELEVTSSNDELTKIKKTEIEFLKYAHTLLESAKSIEEQQQSFILAQRILFSLHTQTEPYKGFNFIDRVLQLPTTFSLSFPFIEPEKKNTPIGLKQANEEAHFLFDGTHYLSREELATLTPEQIADLDIDPFHPAWFSEEEMKTRRDNWKALELWHEQNASAYLKERYPELSETTFLYSPKKVAQVLFFDEIKDTATSPKLEAEDGFGFKWKVKFGEEVVPSIVSNRLYVKLGGRYTDLVYSNSYGRDGLVLILPVLDNQKEECDNISNVERLKKCFLKSKYKFDVAPYIVTEESGEITEDILKHLEAKDFPWKYVPKKKSKLKNLLGRNYVTFKESASFFFGSGYILRGGPASLDQVGASDDRVARGLNLFNIWISSADVKSDNNRSLLVYDYKTKKQKYVEGEHDMGYSLSGASLPGRLNHFSSERDFYHISHGLLGLGSPKLTFKGYFFHHPETNKLSSYSDLLWMAKKIVRLTQEDFKQIAKESGWPDFMQELLVYKLMARRNHIARIFGIENRLDFSTLSVPSFKIALSTADERQAVSKLFHIDLSLLESELLKIGKLNQPYDDLLIREGKLVACEDAVLLGLLEEFRYPSGLERRTARALDYKPLKTCRYKK